MAKVLGVEDPGTNNWRLNAGTAPSGLAPTSTQMFVKPGVDYSTPAPAPTAPLAAHGPAATFRPATNPAANPAPVATSSQNLDVNGNPTTGAVNGISATGGASATINNATGEINRNAAWRNTTTGSLNVMTPEQNARVSSTGTSNVAPTNMPQTSTGGWGSDEGASYRAKLHDILNTAMTNANAPVGTGPGHRAQWATLAGHLADVLSGSITAQGQQQLGAGELGLKSGELGLKAALNPSEIQKNVATAGYFGNRGESMIENAAARQQLADQQLQIANLKAGAGKYGETERNTEILKGHGFDASPQNLAAYSQGHTKFVPPVKAQGGMWRSLTGSTVAATPGHMIDPSWTPVMKDGKQVIDPASKLPVYKDLKGNVRTPDVTQ